MSKRALVLHVTVVEQDENGNIISSLSDLRESYPAQFGFDTEDERIRQELVRCAYEGYNLARNRFLGRLAGEE